MHRIDESPWESTSVQNLIRYRPSGTYFARFKVGGKLVRQSLETAVFSVAKQRLPDKIREYRSRHESVNFPAPALLSHVDTEDETFDKIIALAGESLDELFDSRHYLKPVADFRDEVAAALPRRAATQLIELCQVECSPRVSFETAETKTKEC